MPSCLARLLALRLDPGPSRATDLGAVVVPECSLPIIIVPCSSSTAARAASSAAGTEARGGGGPEGLRQRRILSAIAVISAATSCSVLLLLLLLLIGGGGGAGVGALGAVVEVILEIAAETSLNDCIEESERTQNE